MILALDPSSTCTGFATFDDGGQLLLDHCGTITPKGDDLPAKLLELAQDVNRLVMEAARPLTVAIERPQTAGGPNRGGYAKQSPMSIASYGAAFGAVYTTVALSMPTGRILTPTPMEWVGRDIIPSSKGDTHKEKRVRWVEHLYRLPPGSLGCKTKAGNVADAILLGRFAAAVGPTWRPAGKRKRERVVVTVRPQGGKG